MDNLAAQLRSKKAVTVVLPLFFVSGATALAYQVTWMRELQLVFGTSTFAISTLLASFMVGLAVGGFLISRYADRFRRPLAIYGFLELGIGLYALVFPFLLTAITPLYLGAWSLMEPGPTAFGLIQFGLVAALLSLPTAAMGATLPLLARFVTRRLGMAGERVGSLYAANTFGAVAGIGLCGFLLLPRIGISTTTIIAAAANVVLGLVALGLDRRLRGGDSGIVDDLHVAPVDRAVMVVVCVSIGLAGFSALAYEVAWTRLLALMLGGSAYTFAVMLIAFLIGIALGGQLGGPVADRLLGKGGRRRVLYAFAAIEIGIAIVAYATMYLYPELPFLYVRLFDEFGVQQRPQALWWASLLLAELVMTPPAVLMGMHFPIAVRAVAGYREKLGRPVGLIYGANTLGGAVGAFIAGFVLLPAVGLQGTVFVAVTVGVAAAGILVLYAARELRWRWALLSPVALALLAFAFVNQRPPWNPLLMTAGMYHYVSKIGDHSRETVRRYSVDLYDLVYYEEGLSSVVTVAQNKGTPDRWLAVNGKVDASTTDDMPTQVLLSLLPLQFVEHPENVMVIGLASGVTAGSASLLPEIETLQIVELEPAVGRAARYFDEWNHSVLSDPRVEVVHNDGRNHLLLTEPASYDVIISEPSNPWISGVANLFTREFLEIGKSRLKPGGVWSQWVPIYGMDDRDLGSILGTFADVFPHVAVYTSIVNADLVVIGSESPIRPTEHTAEHLLSRADVASELRRADVYSTFDLISLFLMGRDEILAWTAGLPRNTDDNMFIEYSTSRKLHLDSGRENFAMLLKSARLPEGAFADDPELWARLAPSYRRRGDAARSIAALSRARDLWSGDGAGDAVTETRGTK